MFHTLQTLFSQYVVSVSSKFKKKKKKKDLSYLIIPKNLASLHPISHICQYQISRENK